MDNYKRINLAFRKDSIRDMEIYYQIANKRNKTEFIVSAMSDFNKREVVEIEVELLKKFIKDALVESGATFQKAEVQKKQDTEIEEIPMDILDMLSNL